MRTFITFPFFALVLVCCGSPPVVTAPEHETDAGDYPSPPDNAIEEHPEGSTLALSSPCGLACENLRRIECSDGFPTPQGISCYRGCLSMARDQRVPTRCWTGAKTVNAARDCGGIRCLVRK